MISSRSKGKGQTSKVKPNDHGKKVWVQGTDVDLDFGSGRYTLDLDVNLRPDF